MSKSDFGLIGLAVMGQNLVLNVESRGFQVSVYNRTTATTDEFVAAHPGKKLVGSKTLEEFVQSLASPRKIQIMVKAGAPVDAVIDGLVPLLEPGDLIATGTCAGVGIGFNPPKFLKPGDHVAITIEPIGTLENPVA